jgi:hypothetical protein
MCTTAHTYYHFHEQDIPVAAFQSIDVIAIIGMFDMCWLHRNSPGGASSSASRAEMYKVSADF